MNTIASLQADLAVKTAEFQALKDGLEMIRAYVASDKFVAEPYVNIGDIGLRVLETLHTAECAGQDAYRNAVGPKIGTGYFTTMAYGQHATSNGYHCPDCHEPLPGDWNDTDARANERMRQHWISEHKQ